MVSLFDIVENSKHEYLHLATALPSLNKSVNFARGIYDFQTTANNLSLYQILIELILCHLELDKPVFIVSCLNRFPFNLLVNHPRFNKHYLAKITSYTTDTYSKLYVVISKLAAYSSSLIIINNIYELLELYKLELSSTYEEMLLKFQIDRNNILLDNMKRLKVDGSMEALPELPQNSDLLQSPIMKFDKHVTNLINNLSRQDNIAFITGNLSTKFLQYPKKSVPLTLETSFSSQASQVGAGRVVLAPFTYFDDYINCRLVFFRDWYHNSPHFANLYPLHNGKVVINRALLRFVYAIKIGQQKIYFDNNQPFYSEINEEEMRSGAFNLIELLDQEEVEPDTSALLDAIQKASNRLTKSQVSSPFLQEPNMDTQDILDTSTQVNKPRGATSALADSISTLADSTSALAEVQENDAGPNVDDTINDNSSDPGSPGSSTINQKSFAVSNNEGIIQIQFLKSQSQSSKLQDTQVLMVDESEDEYLGDLLFKR